MSSLEQFMDTEEWGSPVEVERRNRIKLSIAAYAYEFENTSIISDSDFDDLAKTINIQLSTGNSRMDKFFREHFSEFTGQWIHKHPEKNKLKAIYLKYYRK